MGAGSDAPGASRVPYPSGAMSPRSAAPWAFSLALLGTALVAFAAGAAEPVRGAKRVVSLNPSLTAILVALDASDRLVGLDDFSARQNPALAEVPRVGGLYTPSLEAVVAREPDLVLLVPSAEQRGFQDSIRGLGIEVLAVDPLTFEDVVESIERVGAKIGRSVEAKARADAIRAARAEVQRATRSRAPRRAVLVIQREPLFVVGRGSFLDDMLRDVGTLNVAAEFSEPYPRVSIEWLVAARPELIVDTSADAESAQTYWARWPSLPAVANAGVVAVPQGMLSLPGPDLDRALRKLARLIHGEDVLRAPPVAP